MPRSPRPITSSYEDVWLLGGVRTPFADYNGVLGKVSPTDLGIKVAREVFARTRVPPGDVGAVVAGSMAQAAFDAYVLPRHVGIYAGVPAGVPATMVQRVCGTGIEILMQAADMIALGKIQLGLCVGTESMSRNPIAAYIHRGGFPLGKVEFKDFLWEALRDTAPDVTMGDCAERLAREYRITREEADIFACESFDRALSGQADGWFDDEIVPVRSEVFEMEEYQKRGIRLPRGVEELAKDDHVRPSPIEVLAKLKPEFDGVQTGGNSSAIVDGAGAALVGSGDYIRTNNITPLGRIVAGCVTGVPPENMGIGPIASIRPLLDHTGLSIDDIGRFEINEAFAAQVLAVQRELEIDHARLNVHGGAIAIGHPLAATGVRLAITVARELKRARTRLGIASACIGGGQGIALLIENAE